MASSGAATTTSASSSTGGGGGGISTLFMPRMYRESPYKSLGDTFLVTWLIAVLYLATQINEAFYISLAATVITHFLRYVSEEVIGAPRLVVSKGQARLGVWHNTTASVAHAFVVTVLSLYVMWTERETTFNVSLFPEGIFESGVLSGQGHQQIQAVAQQEVGGQHRGPLIESNSPLCLLIVSITTGYVAYDTYDMFYCGMHITSPHYIVHHATMLICLPAAILTGTYTAALVVALSCEANTVALHARTLMRAAGALQSHNGITQGLYWANWAFLWATFLVTRTFGQWVLNIHLYLAPGSLTTFGAFGTIGCFMINLLNIQLIVSLFKAFGREIREASAKSSSSSSDTRTNGNKNDVKQVAAVLKKKR